MIWFLNHYPPIPACQDLIYSLSKYLRISEKELSVIKIATWAGSVKYKLLTLTFICNANYILSQFNLVKVLVYRQNGENKKENRKGIHRVRQIKLVGTIFRLSSRNLQSVKKNIHRFLFKLEIDYGAIDLKGRGRKNHNLFVKNKYTINCLRK